MGAGDRVHRVVNGAIQDGEVASGKSRSSSLHADGLHHEEVPFDNQVGLVGGGFLSRNGIRGKWFGLISRKGAVRPDCEEEQGGQSFHNRSIYQQWHRRSTRNSIPCLQ